MKRRRIKAKQRWAIKAYVKEGLSANKIQKRLSKQGIGIRRTVLLREIRKVKHKRVKPHRLKYTPQKYRRMISGVEGRPTVRYAGRQVAMYQYARTKRNPRAYSARFEFSGSGKDLSRAIKLALDRRLVPRKEWAFVKVNARDFLSNPNVYGEEGEWTGKPRIES